MNIKICPLIKIDKIILKLKKENFSLLTKKIKKEKNFSIQKGNIKILSRKKSEKEKIS